MWCSSVPHGGGGSGGGGGGGDGGVAGAAIATAAIAAITAGPTLKPTPTPTPIPTNTPLHAAADAGDASAVETLLRSGADPNSRVKRPLYDKGATALHLAARGGHLDVALALLAAGAETSGREFRNSSRWGQGNGDGDGDGDGDDDGDSDAETDGREFHSSSGWGEGNGDGDDDWDGDGDSDGEGYHVCDGDHARDGGGERYRDGVGSGKGKGKGGDRWRRRGEWDGDLTPLHLASAHGHVAVVRALLSAGEPTDLIASGRKVGVGLPTDGSGAGFFGERCSSDSDGGSSGSDSGGDNGGGSYGGGGGGGGHTPLHLASAYGHAAVVRTLTEAGACVRAQGGACDDTPLHLASASGQVEAMAALLEAGADVDAGDEIGNTALHVVADARSLEFLLAAGANPNLAAESPYGCGTPLGSYCTLIHRLETDQKVVRRATAQVRALLRHGADTGVRASRGWPSSSSSASSSSSSSCPILSCAAKNGVPGIVAALLDAGLDPNGRDREGWAPLHDAAWGNHVEVLRLLLQAGAEKNASTGRGGWTALHLACRYTSVDCVLELLRWGVDLSPKTGVDADDDFWCRDLMFGGGRIGVSKGGGKTPAEVIGLKNRAAPTPTAAPAPGPGPGPDPASVPPTEGGGGVGSGGGGRSLDPTEDEDEQMEMFDEETGQRDTGAAERNAIRRALRREVSWRRRRGVVLAKVCLEKRLNMSVAVAAAAAASATAASAAAASASMAAEATAAATSAATAEMAAGPPPPPLCPGVKGDEAGFSEVVTPGNVRPRGVVFEEGPGEGGGSKRWRPHGASVVGVLATPAVPMTSVVGGGGSGGVGVEESGLLRGVMEGVVDLAGCEEALFRQVVMFL